MIGGKKKMRCEVCIADVYDEILDETSKQLVLVENEKTHIGFLFFEAFGEKISRIYDRIEVEGDAIDVMIAAYEMSVKNEIIRYKDTLKTMCHWQFEISGEVIPEAYRAGDDAELYEMLCRAA